jgi:hypothetical protein
MWTSLKANREYTAQITPYHNKVVAEILVKKESKTAFLGDLYLTVAEKYFGSFFQKEVKESDWIKANEWVERQLSMIEKHGTVIVTRPQFIRDILTNIQK